MKKIILVVPIIGLLAAGCNLFGQTPSSTDVNSPTSAEVSATSGTNTNSQIYTNSEFGFQLTLNDQWKGYKVVRSESTTSPKFVRLTFFQPTTDKEYSKNGYPVLALLVYKKADYNAALKLSNANPDPGPGDAQLKRPVAQSDAYVVIQEPGGNGFPPTDIAIGNDDANAVTATLKFTK